MQTNHELIQYAMDSIKAYERSKQGGFLVAARVALSQCGQPKNMKHKTINLMSETRQMQTRYKKRRIGGFIHPKRGFKKRLARAIDDMDMSKIDICNRAEINPSALYRYLSPGNSMPSIMTLNRLSKALGVTEKSLLG